MTRPRPVKVIAISGGKGGIGKTNVTTNLAIAISALGKNVMLLDADLGLANIDVLLGLTPKQNLSHVFAGEADLKDVIIEGPGGVQIIPAASGIQNMTQLSQAQHAGLVSAFSEVGDDLDVLLIDTAAGISDGVISFCRAAQEVIMVVCDEPTSITDAYASIKVFSRDYNIDHFKVLANMVGTSQDGRDLFNKLVKATDRFLDVTLDFVGSVPYDENLRRAVQKQKSVFLAYPSSKSSIAFKNIAKRVVSWPNPPVSGDHVSFFLERLIQAA